MLDTKCQSFLIRYICKLQLWAAPILTKQNVAFGVWCEQQCSDDAKPDSLTIVFMSHFVNKSITLVSGKADEWTTSEDADEGDENIVLVYKGNSIYAPTDVGTCCSSLFCFFP